jgi:dihydrofolate synthase/folylpolyglutamate synthase
MHTPPFTTLANWLNWQESLHPRAIDLGLDRVRTVAEQLGVHQPAATVITVAGTNGKGSSVAFLEAILTAAGYRVGSYTSPHLLRYNERIRVAGAEVDDAALCEAFARIDAARGNLSLTYFEFGTLAALLLFREAGVPVAVLEVGLGGRLDAVNLVDADAALITSIALDHTDWLGADRDSIGREKAGVCRPGRPLICAEPAPPDGLLAVLRERGARHYQVGRDYTFQRDTDHWQWGCATARLTGLPLPGLPGDHQLSNAAAVLMTLHTLADRLPVVPDAIHTGLRRAWIAARCQRIPGPVEWLLDVAHNPHGAAALARYLAATPARGRTHLVLGLLADKDAAAVARALDGAVDCWYTATLGGPRGRDGAQLAAVLRQSGVRRTLTGFADVAAACRAAAGAARRGDRIVVCGSFYTVAEALASGLPVGAPSAATAMRGFNLG